MLDLNWSIWRSKAAKEAASDILASITRIVLSFPMCNPNWYPITFYTSLSRRSREQVSTHMWKWWFKTNATCTNVAHQSHIYVAHVRMKVKRTPRFTVPLMWSYVTDQVKLIIWIQCYMNICSASFHLSIYIWAYSISYTAHFLIKKARHTSATVPLIWPCITDQLLCSVIGHSCLVLYLWLFGLYLREFV